MPAKPRVVVFDFDGVVVDSPALHIATWREVLERYQAELTDEVYTGLVGWSPVEIARTLVKKTSVGLKPEQLASEKTDLYVARARTELRLMPGAPEALQRLSGEFPVGITASQPREFIDEMMNKFGLQADTVMTRQDLDNDDELSDLLAVAVRQLDGEPDRAVMVDDSRNGILAATRLGMKTIAFDSHPNLQLDYSMADAQVQSLDELVPELINQVVAA